MDPTQLCSFFNRLQALVHTPAAVALGELGRHVRALHGVGQATAFVIVRDSVAGLVLSLTGLVVEERYALLRSILTARSLDKLARAIDEHTSDQQATDPRVVSTLRLIEVGCHDRRVCKLTYLAKRVTLSQWHLSKLVHKQTGRRVAEHIRRARVERASKLILADPKIPLRLVARAVGYKDDTDLCHNFQLETHCSPREYIRLSQSSNPPVS